MSGVCIVVGAGFFDGFKRKPQPRDYIIAADGGYEYCRRRGVTPDLVVGDFDSLGHVPDVPNLEQMPVEKDETDMFHAINRGLERGYSSFEIYGGAGGEREDHTIANLQCLMYLAKRGAKCVMYGKGIAYAAISDGVMDFPPECSGTISIFCLDGKAEGVTLRGLKYPLTDYTMRSDYPIGVSNSFTGEAAAVAVKKGCLVIIYNI